MSSKDNGRGFSRRRFAFWIGFGLFSLGEKLRASTLDDLAAAAMGGSRAKSTAIERPPAVHWRASENRTWRWYEREDLVGGEWVLAGITTPMHKETGEPYTGKSGYLDPADVPRHLRRGERIEGAAGDREAREAPAGRPDSSRRARHGRPPSRWLRSLYADELRIWLKTIDVPEAGVEGMTYWTHLTRDHMFDPARIEGLAIEEQAKLHAAAHFGY
jgi:hypothetical protein